MSPITSPFEPWILVPRSQIASVTSHQHLCHLICRNLKWRLTSRHGHASRWPIFVFYINDLMVDDIVSTFIYTSSIWTGLERLGDILNIEYIGIKDVLSPLRISKLVQMQIWI